MTLFIVENTTPLKNNVVSLFEKRDEIHAKAYIEKAIKAGVIPTARTNSSPKSVIDIMRYTIDCYTDVIRLAIVTLHEIETGAAKDPTKLAGASLSTINKVINQVIIDLKL